MAKLWITECLGMGSIGNAPVAAPSFPPVTTQTVTFTTSTASSALSGATRLVLIQADADCHLAFGADPTATTNHMLLEAKKTYPFAVTSPGLKVAAVTAS